MTVALTRTARQSAQKVKKEPAIVVVFEGIAETFGSAGLFRFIKIGDPGLLIGDAWKIGGRVLVEGQIDAISFSGTSTRLDYKLSPDLAVGEAVSSMAVKLIDDKALTLLSILSANEFLGRKCRVLLSPDSTDTVYPDDYITIFRGIVDDISTMPGAVVLTLSHPDAKKRQTIFTSAEGELPSGINNSVSTIGLGDNAANLLPPITGPNGLADTNYKTYVKIDNEIIRYTGVSGNNITGCTRGTLGTTAATHASEAAWKSFYQIEGNCIDIALKIMLSGWGDYYKTGVEVSHFNYISTDTLIPNSIFFSGVNVFEEYGLTSGDYVTTSSATETANNVTLKQILSVVVTGNGSYITVDDVTFTDEFDSAATISFRSKYDTLGDGLRMSPDEVDVEQHEKLRSLFLSSFSYDLYIKETIESAKDFISKEIYKPIACYSVPRKAKASVAYTIGPLPLDEIKTLNDTNVLNAGSISKRRSIGRNFYNTIIYKYDEDAATDTLLKGFITTDSSSRSQIQVGTKAFVVESKGLRSENVAQSSATRRLNRYAFAADYISQIKTTFAAGFNIEVADLVLLDGEALKISDSTLGTNTTPVRFYEVVSKSIDLKTGEVSLELTNTNYATAARYALISPASRVKSGISGTSFVIESSFASVYGTDEYLKWSRYENPYIRVRTSDYSTAATAQVDRFSGNTVILKQSLGFTASAGMLMEFSDYAQASDEIKLLYTHITNGSADFADDGPPYVMI
jgi:hypothetical protein